MKRYSKLICLVVLFMFISVFAFAEGDKGKDEVGDEKVEPAKEVKPPPGGKYKFVWSFTSPPMMDVGEYRLMHPIWAAALAFKAALYSRVGDQIDVQLFHSGQLGSNEETSEAVKAGLQEGMVIGEGDLARYFAPFNLIGTPYAFKAPIILYEVMDGPFGDKFKEEFRKETGIRIIGCWDNGGFRSLVNSKRPVHSPEDVEGLKIRTMMIPAHMEIIDSWGGSATPISWTELYTAAQTGVVDGFENSPINFIGPKLYEVFDYMTLTQHVFSVIVFLVNDEWFESLPEHLKIAVLEAGDIAQAAGRGGCRSAEAVALDEIARLGKEIYAPTPEEKEAFAELAVKGTKKFLEDAVDKEWRDEFFAAIAEAEKKWGY
jgi:tripartite ATP-independent transporter DctP family solute receptor